MQQTCDGDGSPIRSRSSDVTPARRTSRTGYDFSAYSGHIEAGMRRHLYTALSSTRIRVIAHMRSAACATRCVRRHCMPSPCSPRRGVRAHRTFEDPWRGSERGMTVSTSTLAPALRRSRAQLLEIWRQSLVVDGYTDPRESALHELALYFNITPEEARARCEHWEQDSVREWENAPRDTPEGLLDFYRTQQSWIYDTVWYHAQQCFEEQPAESVMIAERMADVVPGHHLDFGAGPGSTSLFFQRLGWQVSLADISTTMQAFAKWRLVTRGVPAHYLHTTPTALPTHPLYHIPHPIP